MDRIPYFDAHCDTISRCCYNGWSLADNSGHISLKQVENFTPYDQIFAFFGPLHSEPEQRNYPALLRMHDYYLREMNRCQSSVIHCSGRAEILHAVEQQKTAALLSIEECGLPEHDPGKLQLAASWGVQSVNLTWNHRNALA